MKVVPIGPDAVALKIDSASDYVRSLTPEELSQNHVNDTVVTIYRSYFDQVQAGVVADVPEITG